MDGPKKLGQVVFGHKNRFFLTESKFKKGAKK